MSKQKKSYWKEYFSFTRKERIATILLLVIIVTIFLLPNFIKKPALPVDKATLQELEQQLAALKPMRRDSARVAYSTQNYRAYPNRGQPYERYVPQPGQQRTYPSGYKPYYDTNRPTYPVFKKKTYPAKPINLNKADTSLLATLPGIGSKLAQRIVSFREKLGGFQSVDQLKQVYGLQDSVFQKLRPHLQIN